MKLIKNVVFIMALFSTVTCAAHQATPSLCTSAETIIFSCATTKSKTIALCINKRNQLITYRYGALKKVELSHSAKLTDENGFFYNHYFRHGADYSRISFVVAGYEYAIFKNYDATEAPSPSYGIAISKNGNQQAQIKCQFHVIDNLPKFIKRLKCNEQSALGCS